MIYGTHKLLPWSTTHFTLLREPIERVISHDCHVHRDADHPYHDYLVSDNMGIKEYVETGIHLGMSDFQTRVFAGTDWHNAEYGRCPGKSLNEEIVRGGYK